MSASILEGSSSYSSEHGKRRRPDSTSSESRPSVRQTLLQLVSHERAGHRNRIRPSGQKAIQRHSMQVSPQMMFIITAGTVARTALGHFRRSGTRADLVWCNPIIGSAECTQTLRRRARSGHSVYFVDIRGLDPLDALPPFSGERRVKRSSGSSPNANASRRKAR
jgi:hypothetical protein